LADFRGADDYISGGDLQLSTPNETNFLRLFGGRLDDPHPFIAFHELDTFHLVTTSADFSTYTRRMTMLPNGFVGLGTDKPSAELDIVSDDVDDGVKLQMSNSDTSHFLRLYSGRENLPKPIMYWNHGDTLELGMSQPDENNYQRFLSLNGKTIGVHNTGGSVFIGEQAGEQDDGTSNYSTAIGFNALQSNTSGASNTVVGAFAMNRHRTGAYNVGVGSNVLSFDSTGHNNTAIGSAAMRLNRSGGWNTAVGVVALERNKSGNSNVAVGSAAMAEDTIGGQNTAIGANALSYLRNGDNNTALGYFAGGSFSDKSYSGCVMIGHFAGAGQEEDDRLFIANSGGTPLIYGEFDNDMIRINGWQEVTGDFIVGSAMAVDESAERVGIRTTVPAYPLDINGQLNLNKNIASGVALRVNANEALWYNGTYYSWGFGAAHNWFGRPATFGPLEGGTTPFAKLHVIDDGFTYLQVESHSGDAILQLSGNTDAPSIGWTMRRDVSDSGKLQWRHDDASRMTMTTGGSLGIGVTVPNYQLHLSLDSAGKPGGGSWTNSSDRRLKQNINAYQDGLAEIQKIRPVTFHYNVQSGYDTTPEYVGVIAQELQEVAPYMVSENESGYLDVNNSAMTYMLVNAVKEQQDIIQQQQRMISALLVRVDALESQEEQLKTDISAELTTQSGNDKK
jgi:hypothetical protein